MTTSNQHVQLLRYTVQRGLEPQRVLVTGTFDNWSGAKYVMERASSATLKRSASMSSSGSDSMHQSADGAVSNHIHSDDHAGSNSNNTTTVFLAQVLIPRTMQHRKLQFKFIVDGAWVTSADYPVERDMEGNLNNYLTLAPAYQDDASPMAKKESLLDGIMQHSPIMQSDSSLLTPVSSAPPSPLMMSPPRVRILAVNTALTRSHSQPSMVPPELLQTAAPRRQRSYEDIQSLLHKAGVAEFASNNGNASPNNANAAAAAAESLATPDTPKKLRRQSSVRFAMDPEEVADETPVHPVQNGGTIRRAVGTSTVNLLQSFDELEQKSKQAQTAHEMAEAAAAMAAGNRVSAGDTFDRGMQLLGKMLGLQSPIEGPDVVPTQTIYDSSLYRVEPMPSPVMPADVLHAAAAAAPSSAPTNVESIKPDDLKGDSVHITAEPSIAPAADQHPTSKRTHDLDDDDDDQSETGTPLNAKPISHQLLRPEKRSLPSRSHVQTPRPTAQQLWNSQQKQPQSSPPKPVAEHQPAGSQTQRSSVQTIKDDEQGAPLPISKQFSSLVGVHAHELHLDIDIDAVIFDDHERAVAQQAATSPHKKPTTPEPAKTSAPQPGTWSGAGQLHSRSASASPSQHVLSTWRPNFASSNAGGHQRSVTAGSVASPVSPIRAHAERWKAARSQSMHLQPWHETAVELSSPSSANPSPTSSSTTTTATTSDQRQSVSKWHRRKPLASVLEHFDTPQQPARNTALSPGIITTPLAVPVSPSVPLSSSASDSQDVLVIQPDAPTGTPEIVGIEEDIIYAYASDQTPVLDDPDAQFNFTYDPHLGQACEVQLDSAAVASPEIVVDLDSSQQDESTSAMLGDSALPPPSSCISSLIPEDVARAAVAQGTSAADLDHDLPDARSSEDLSSLDDLGQYTQRPRNRADSAGRYGSSTSLGAVQPLPQPQPYQGSFDVRGTYVAQQATPSTPGAYARRRPSVVSDLDADFGLHNPPVTVRIHNDTDDDATALAGRGPLARAPSFDLGIIRPRPRARARSTGVLDGFGSRPGADQYHPDYQDAERQREGGAVSVAASLSAAAVKGRDKTKWLTGAVKRAYNSVRGPTS